jgi:hypothetical protein
VLCLPDFDDFNLIRTDKSDVVAKIAVDDDKAAVERVPIGDATAEAATFIAKVYSRVNAWAGGGSCVGHGRKLADERGDTRKKSFIFFYEIAIFFLTNRIVGGFGGDANSKLQNSK